jgi:hypothetical protein
MIPRSRLPVVRLPALVALVLLGVLVVPVAAPAAGPRARNPILWADVPDLAVIRVGDTYYMSSTTMHLSPGLPIMQSRDLVNWRLIGYAYDTLEDNDALTLRNGKRAYGAGSWASSLRHHDGTFYATTFSSTTGRTHVYRTRTSRRVPGPRTPSGPRCTITPCSSTTTGGSTCSMVPATSG